ncbi:MULTISPECIES: hypothetical protein [unclassified Paenibacillus]|uniref:hypothetical protein n=1 Tax=unclassified Paenibacillus TaxID=185978 RepID=UPI002404BB70|nr:MULTISPECIES: hypothetical protein [unclassified Paenibacillus]MDF9842850.1 putative nucleic acid-binding Zn-ribbon protein [Paenibacillus sp. PastF-2]MDF9849282.1 putative nucleic acid-binding Zn-ribbon protein [Paenibacillus sp. PastM-2]MDF9856010.1 putative nucleic acid-binding Zn-ribbon protein [Paenibacillus sp. PastF-1]MDH6481123.1 putative nucleic acid-binding Zn-ribbon protein [Paenibacillus sp. PastH-2]MDH6508544.1 putative nucleic acid-binding Zn-ribbon protein [Paenibacillus sp. 
MATEAQENVEETIDSEVWLEMIYKLLSENEVRRMAAIVQPPIQGFKNPVKAPPAMLRKKTVEKIKKFTNPVSWMEKWYDPNITKVKEAKIDFEEFCHTYRIGDTVTPAEAVAVTGILFPALFNESVVKMQQNIEEKKHPLEELGTKKLAFKRQLQIKALAWEDPPASDAVRFLMEEALNLNPEIEGSLKEWLQEKGSVESGEIALLASTKMGEISKWTEGEKAAFFQMAFHDSQKAVWKIMTDLLKEKGDLEREDKAKERRLKRLEKLNTDREEADAALKKEIGGLEGKLAAAEAELEKTRTSMQAEKDSLMQQHISLTQAAAARESDDFRLVKESDFVLITRSDREDYANLLPAEQIITIRDTQDLLEHQLESGIKYIFVHSDSFSSKEQFYLDELIEAYDRPFKSVSGGVSAVTRQIIYYFEGAMINEINT